MCMYVHICIYKANSPARSCRTAPTNPAIHFHRCNSADAFSASDRSRSSKIFSRERARRPAVR